MTTTPMTTAQRLQATLTDTQTALSRDWPEILPFISNTSTSKLEPASSLSSHDLAEVAAISQEERSSLAERLRMIAALAPGILDEPTSQDVSRQLSFATKQPVSFNLSGQQLSHHHGVCETIQEPTTPLQPIWPGESRGEREWYVHVSALNARGALQSDWQQPWFMHSRVLVIHPQTMIAVVATITGIVTEKMNRYQFGVSRSVMRQTGMWSPAGAGRAIICFLNAPIPPGTTFQLLDTSA